MLPVLVWKSNWCEILPRSVSLRRCSAGLCVDVRRCPSVRKLELFFRLLLAAILSSFSLSLSLSPFQVLIHLYFFCWMILGVCVCVCLCDRPLTTVTHGADKKRKRSDNWEQVDWLREHQRREDLSQKSRNSGTCWWWW